METEMKIIPPVGYEIDKENSTFDCIKFKPVKQELTYRDICKKIFKNGIYYFTNFDGGIIKNHNDYEKRNFNNAPTKGQLEKILAINQLQNIANYYNSDWKPDWKNQNENKYSIYFEYKDKYSTSYSIMSHCSYVYFKNEADAQAVIDNPNFREILDKIYKS